MRAVIGRSSAEVKPSELADGLRAAWYTTWAGALFSIPPTALAAAGLIFKGNRPS
jgi:hypothetical protein